MIEGLDRLVNSGQITEADRYILSKKLSDPSYRLKQVYSFGQLNNVRLYRYNPEKAENERLEAEENKGIMMLLSVLITYHDIRLVEGSLGRKNLKERRSLQETARLNRSRGCIYKRRRLRS